MHTEFRQRSLRERNHLEDLAVDGSTILKWIFDKWRGVWNCLIWLRTGTGGGIV